MYPSRSSIKCRTLLEEANKYNLPNHPMAKEIREEVFKLTSQFPAQITFSTRVRAVAEQKECRCVACGKIHGVPEKTYCSKKCYLTVKVKNAIDPKEASHKARAEQSEKKFANKQEGIDFLVCAICGVKSGDLGSHVHMHQITPAEYKKKYGLRYLKPERNRELRKGKNNPAFNHGGKYSAWSKNFVKGYDETRHKENNERQRKFVNENPHLFKNNIAYWIEFTNGDIEEANKLHKKFQIRNLNYFIDKYGKEEGVKRHALKIKRWLTSYKSSNFSQISQELFNSIAKRLNRADIYYATYNRPEQQNRKNKEYVLPVGNCKFIRPDFICLDLKKIIEFDGEYWHSEAVANPLREKQRDQFIVNAGYQVLHIKERDYNANKEKVIEKCINFLTEQNENSQT